MRRGVRAAPGPRHPPNSPPPGHPSPVGMRRGAAPIPASLLPQPRWGFTPQRDPTPFGGVTPQTPPLPPVPISSAMWGCTLGEKDLTEPRGCPNLGVPPLHLHCAHLPSYHGVTSPAVPPECTHGCPAGGWSTTMCACVCVCVLGGSLELPPPTTSQLPHCSTVLP